VPKRRGWKRSAGTIFLKMIGMAAKKIADPTLTTTYKREGLIA
jgi:hypothetical protein